MQSIVKKLQPIVSMFSSGKHASIYLIFPYFYPDTGAHLEGVLLRNVCRSNTDDVAMFHGSIG